MSEEAQEIVKLGRETQKFSQKQAFIRSAIVSGINALVLGENQTTLKAIDQIDRKKTPFLFVDLDQPFPDAEWALAHVLKATGFQMENGRLSSPKNLKKDMRLVVTGLDTFIKSQISTNDNHKEGNQTQDKPESENTDDSDENVKKVFEVLTQIRRSRGQTSLILSLKDQNSWEKIQSLSEENRTLNNFLENFTFPTYIQ